MAAVASIGSIEGVRSDRIPATTSRWGFLSRYWETIQATAKEFSKSLFGRIAVSAGAEALGAYLGEQILTPIVAKVGQFAGPLLLTGAVIKGGMALSGLKLSRRARLFFTSTLFASGVLVLTVSSGTSCAVGEWVGSIAGQILGGYIALRLAETQVVLLDPRNPWDSYSVCTLRYCCAGDLFNTVVAKSSLPWVGPILNIPRAVVKTFFQFFCYNSNTAIPVIQGMIGPESSIGKFVPRLTDMLCARFSIPNTAISIRGFYTSILPDFVFNKTQLFLNLPDTIRTRDIAYFATRSLHAYFSVLKSSDTIKPAIQEYRQAILEDSKLRDGKRKAFIAAMREKIPFDVLTSKTAKKVTERFFSKSGARLLIRDIEISLVGFPIIKKKQIEFLDEVYFTLMRFYFDFVLKNHRNLREGLRPSEEREFLYDMNRAIFTYYFDSIMSERVKNGLSCAVGVTLYVLSETKRRLGAVLRQPEQVTDMPSEPNVVPNYCREPSPFDDCIFLDPPLRL